MKASIIKIGNSKGVRIPKVLLEESKLGPVVDIKTKDGKIIISASRKSLNFNEEYLLSYRSFAKDWDTPEEDAAWAYLQ